jgi:hypothetical protein
VEWGLTKDDRNDEGLDICCTGLVGISRKVGDVQAQGGIVTQHSVEICKVTLVRGKRRMIQVHSMTYCRETPKLGSNRSEGWAG